MAVWQVYGRDLQHRCGGIRPAGHEPGPHLKSALLSLSAMWHWAVLDCFEMAGLDSEYLPAAGAYERQCQGRLSLACHSSSLSEA